MRLKKIKPEMAVHYKNEKEKKMLLEEAERLGYVWYQTKGKPTTIRKSRKSRQLTSAGLSRFCRTGASSAYMRKI